MSPIVSVVIPVYNGSATIGDTLRSLQAQSGAPAFEVIVVDNGSTDATREVVSRFDVTLLDEVTRGPAAARNRGLRDARADIVAHCDADTVLTRRWLSELVEPLRDPGVAVVAGQTLAYRPATGAERYAAASGIWDAARAVVREPFPFAPSLNMAVRRADALEAGGWDESLMTGEDVEFSHRLLLLAPGRRIAYAPGALLFHRNRASDEALRRQAESYGRGIAQLYLRHARVLPWTPRLSLTLASRLAVRLAAVPTLAALARVRLVSAQRAEFARYHGMWNLAHWRRFAAEFRKGRRQPSRQCSCA